MFRSILSVLLLSVLFASQAQASTATFAVSAESTFINVLTGESRRNGLKVGKVRVDLVEIEAFCREGDQSFEGFVRLVPGANADSGAVAVECLQRVEDPRMASRRQDADPIR